MPGKAVRLCVVIALLFVVSCASENEKQLVGKWVLASKIIGSSPQSYWFKKNGDVVAPWQEHERALRSLGRYDVVNDTHLELIMSKGYYKGITFFYNIVNVDNNELILRGSIQDIKMKRVE